MTQDPHPTGLIQTLQLEKALRDAALRNPGNAKANFELARFLTETERGAEALPFAEIACKLAPQNFHYLYYCGALYRDFQQPEYALGLLREAVRIEPRVFLSNLDLASCYRDLGHGDAALRHFRAALKLASDSRERYQARMGLATCLSNSGDIEQALRLLESARRERPADAPPDADCRIANLKKAGPQSPEARRLQALLEDPATIDEWRENILLALGNVHVAAGEHDEAFRHWSASRELVKARLLTLGVAIERDRDTDYRERARFYRPELIQKVAPWGHDSEAPVFIAGMPRSGTTLTEQILGSHPDATPVGEIGRWTLIERAFQADYRENDRITRLEANAQKGELKARAEEHLVLMRAIANRPSARYIEKTTQNYEWLGYLATCFPKARFLHLIRHPADTFISTYQNQFPESFPFAFDQVAYAKEYAFSIRMMQYWKSVYGEQIDTYFYEDLTDDTETMARRMVSFIGLPWNDSCLNFHQSRNVVRTFSAQQVKKPIYRTSVDKWRMFEKHLKPLLDELERQGVTYAPGHVTVAPLTP